MSKMKDSILQASKAVANIPNSKRNVRAEDYLENNRLSPPNIHQKGSSRSNPIYQNHAVKDESSNRTSTKQVSQLVQVTTSDIDLDSSKLNDMRYDLLTLTQCHELTEEIQRILAEEEIDEKERSDLQRCLSRLSYPEEKGVTNAFAVALGILGGVTEKIGGFMIGGKVHYSHKELAEDLKIEEGEIAELAPGRYKDINSLFLAMGALGIDTSDIVGYPPQLVGEAASKFSDKFENEYDEAFNAKLVEFRGNSNLAPNIKFKGGEGQIYLSDQHKGLCMKRWYKSRLGVKDQSIKLLHDVKALVESNDEVTEYMAVVSIYEIGDDYIIRDFDGKSKPHASNAGEELLEAAKAAVAKVEGLEGVLTKLNNDSDNLHWAPSIGKILIIDMM